MMRTTLAVLALLALFPGRATAEAVDRAKLRELTQLPTFSFTVGVGFTFRDGFTHARVAGGASEMLGLLGMIALGDPQRLTTEFLRAVSRDPSRDRAWEGLIATLQCREQVEAVCREWLRRKDTAHQRLLLAKLLAERQEYRQAEEELRTALKLEPASARIHAALAAVLLKGGDDALLPAGELLDRAEKLLGASASSEDRKGLTVTRSLHLALSGDPDEARKRLRQLLEQDRDNKQAREALAVLESEPAGSYKILPSLTVLPGRNVGGLFGTIGQYGLCPSVGDPGLRPR